MKRIFFELLRRNLFFNLIFILSFVACVNCSSNNNLDEDPQIIDPPLIINPSFEKVESIINNSPIGDYVMVMAHRGGFTSTPENSISAIQNSIDSGVDIVELDVQLSKDGFLVIMHDNSINRTTNGSGLVSDYTLAELKQFKLLMPNGAISDEFIPSLKEALEYSKGKMHLFIDKGDDYLDIIFADMLETGTVEQTIMGGTMPFSTYVFRYPEVWDKINYIPRAGLGQTLDYLTAFEDGINPLGYFPSCNLISSNNEVFNKIKDLNKWTFTTTLAGSNCSEQVFEPHTIWNWAIEQGIHGIFTDQPQELVEFLTSKGLHDNE